MKNQAIFIDLIYWYRCIYYIMLVRFQICAYFLLIIMIAQIQADITPELLYHHKEFAKAKVLSTSILTEHPHDVFSYNNMLKIGMYNYYDKNFKQAEKYFLKALKYTSDSLEVDYAHYWLGKTYLYQNKKEQAITSLRRASAYNKELAPDYLFFYGIALYQVGQFDDAMNCFVNFEAQTSKNRQPKELPLFLAATALGRKDYNLSKDILDDNNLMNNPDFSPIPAYLQALNFYLTDEKEKSMNILRKITRDTIQSELTDNARLVLGVIYTERNELGKAAQEFDTLINQPDNQFKEYALLSAGIVYYKLKQTNKANERFDSLLAVNPVSVWVDAAIFYKARILEHSRRWSKAQTEYWKFIAAYPTSDLTEQAKINLGRLMMQDKNFLEVIPLYEGFLTDFPKSTNREEGLFNLINSCFELKKYNKVQTYGEQYVHEFKKSERIFQVYYWLGQVGIAKSNQSYALKYLSLITGGAMYAYAMKDIGDIYLNSENSLQAVNYYNLAERFSTDTMIDQMRFAREQAYLKLGQYESELIMMQNFLEKYPDSHKAGHIQHQIGQYFLKNRDFSRALIELNKAYKYAPSEDLIPVIEIDKADCYMQLADSISALTSYLKVIVKYPKATLADKALKSAADIYYAREKFDSAIGLYAQLITDYPKAQEIQEVYLNLADVYRKLNRPAESVDLLERFIKLFSQSDRLEKAHYELFDCYIELGKFSLAEKKINEILMTFGKSGRLYFKMASLNSIQNKPNQAKSNFLNAFDYYSKEEQHELAALCLLEAGKSAVVEKKYDEARDLFNRCMILTQDERLRIECGRQLQLISEKK